MAERKKESRYGKPVPITQLHNPFAHMESTGAGRTKEDIAAEKKKKADTARNKAQAEAIKARSVKQKSWYDYPGEALRSVGDYLRGVKKK